MPAPKTRDVEKLISFYMREIGKSKHIKNRKQAIAVAMSRAGRPKKVAIT
jgi:hypothetical protein